MSLNNSREIVDAQKSVHKNLEVVVKKHFLNPYQKPIADHTQAAFDQIKGRVERSISDGVPLIFDSCCGTAMSTNLIAKDNPDALIVGIDRSNVRLSKESNALLPDNALLVQAECADFWCLAHSAGWKLSKHTILYPNPYPKSKHLKRRWHGHPVLPVLLALGGEIELRSNWKVYVEEFCASVNFAKSEGCVVEGVKMNVEISAFCPGVEVFQTERPLTLFEKKYQEGGQKLYRLKVLF